MSETILIVDDKDRVAQRVRLALGDSQVQVNSVADPRTAKQHLIQSEVALLMVDVALGADQTGGVTLCRQLREHERFSNIPVILLSDSLGDELIQLASECGAQGLVGWPFPLESIKQRLLTLLGQNSVSSQLSKAKSVPATATPAAAPPPPAAAPVVEVSSADKIKHAQHLLALVLHNLKTSNLLDLVELEDIPGIVLQMTRNVCGETAEVEQEKPVAKESDSSNDVSLDLDSVFGIKK